MIRQARPEDAESIADAFVASLESLTFLPRLHTLEEHRGFIGEIVPRDHEIWVAEDDGRVVGLAAIGKDTLGHLYVHPDWHGRGFGSALLAKTKELRPRGFTLWTFPQNERACRFYEQRGLHPIRFTDGSRNEEKLPDVQYEWKPPTPASAAAGRESSGRSRGAGSRSSPRRSP